METRTAYHWDTSRVFRAVSDELQSPMEPGVFYPPGDATFDPAPEVPEGKQAVRNLENTAWSLEDIPPVPEDTEHEGLTVVAAE